MIDLIESQIKFAPDTPSKDVLALVQTALSVMASACEDSCLYIHLLQVRQVLNVDADSDPILRVDYEFWTMPEKFDPANPERVTYKREHLYVLTSVLNSRDLSLHALGPEFGFEEWFNDNTIEGNPEEASLPEEGYAALLREVTDNHLNAIAEYLVDDEASLPQGIGQAMLQLYSSTERAHRQATKVWEQQESRREAERQQVHPTWDPQSLHFVQHSQQLTLRLFSPERQFIWTASVSLIPDGYSLSIGLSKGRKVPSPLNYVPVSKKTTKSPCPISPDSAECALRELFTSGWLGQQLESL